MKIVEIKDEIISYLNKAVKIYYKNSDNYKDGDLLVLVTVLNNLAQAYPFQNNLDNTIKSFSKVAVLRKKYYFYSDAQIGIGDREVFVTSSHPFIDKRFAVASCERP